jgi:HK97 family phage portal protein
VGAIARRLGRKAGVGYPNVGWSPPFGWAQSTSSGVTVTQDKANTIAAWYAGVTAIAQDVSTLPLITYRQNGRNKDRATDHPMYDILKKSPNPEMTSVVYRETAMGHLLNWGNAYAERELDGNGRTVRLWPLRPDRMEVTLGDRGQRVYEYRVRETSAPTALEADRVFHIPGMGFDGLVVDDVLLPVDELRGLLGDGCYDPGMSVAGVYDLDA